MKLQLGAMSHLAVSFESPEYTADVDAMVRCACSRRSASSVWKRKPVSIRLLLRTVRSGAGNSAEETTPFTRDLRMRLPNCTLTGSPLTTAIYGMYACNGILFNHESRAVARLSLPAKSPAQSPTSPGAGVVPVSRQYGFPAWLGPCQRTT